MNVTPEGLKKKQRLAAIRATHWTLIPEPPVKSIAKGLNFDALREKECFRCHEIYVLNRKDLQGGGLNYCKNCRPLKKSKVRNPQRDLEYLQLILNFYEEQVGAQRFSTIDIQKANPKYQAPSMFGKILKYLRDLEYIKLIQNRNPLAFIPNFYTITSTGIKRYEELSTESK